MLRIVKEYPDEVIAKSPKLQQLEKSLLSAKTDRLRYEKGIDNELGSTGPMANYIVEKK